MFCDVHGPQLAELVV